MDKKWTLLIAVVILWWVANTIVSIISKKLMIDGSPVTSGVTNWTPAFVDLRWIELTAFQLLFGGTVAMIWLRTTGNRNNAATNSNAKASKYTVVAAIIINLVGNLATNAAYATISSSSTQVIKSFEPIFIFTLLRCFYKEEEENLTYIALSSVTLMSLGASMFVVGDSSFNVWGVGAAVVSNIAFAVRNILLKKLYTLRENSLQTYAIISFYGGMFILPVVLLMLGNKVVFLKTLPGATLRTEYAVSSFFHFVYNLASISVLRVGPLSHSLLNLSERVIVILANIIFFSIPFSLIMAFGFLVFLLGLVMYHLKSLKRHALKLFNIKYNSLRCIIVCISSISLVLVFSGLLVYHNSSSKENVNYVNINKKCKILEKQQYMTTSWVYSKELPKEVVSNINSMHFLNPNTFLCVYCGTSQCIKAITDLKNHLIDSEFLVIPKILKDTPLESWFSRHPINKVLVGPEFENHLQEVVQLALQWHCGGLYFNPTLSVKNFIMPSQPHNAWISSRTNNLTKQTFKFEISNFSSHHPFVAQLMENYVKDYPKFGDISHSTWPLAFDFQRTIRDTFAKFCSSNSNTCPTIITQHVSELNFSRKSSHHFATLTYDQHVAKYKGANLGNEIQGFPGLQFLPYVNKFLERDNLDQSKGTGHVTVFFNAWWGDRKTSWPPPSNIDPLLLSIHLDSEFIPIIKKNLEYFRNKAPIGSKDIETLHILHNLLGPDAAYFSGCLTLLLKNPNQISSNHRKDIYLVDVKSDYESLLPVQIREKAIKIEQYITGDEKDDNMKRFSAAYNLIEKYSRASIVITQRIHAALPCVAMGTPVIFINSPYLKGGGGSDTKPSPRTTGLLSLFHTLDMYTMSVEDAKEWLSTFNWQDPPPNPDVGKLMRIRATAWDVIRQRSYFYDASQKFGLIPFSPPPVAEKKELLFHLVFTTTSKSTVSVFGSTKSVSGAFNWRHFRTLESIFYHHPFAKVIIHSNTLLQRQFNVLTEVGYNVEVLAYTLEDLVKDTPAASFVGDKLKSATGGKYWYAHESDLIRLLVLYKWGGVYIDTDVILVHSFDNLKLNKLVWHDLGGTGLNNGVMMFEKDHTFLRDCLKEFALTYRSDDWSYNGPRLLTRILGKWKDANGLYQQNGSDVQIMEKNAFYMFSFDVVEEQCFQDTSESSFAEHMKTMKEKAYGVHLASKMTGLEGMESKLKEKTFCKYILNEFCVLCNRIY